jgi:hypothetical protein
MAMSFSVALPATQMSYLYLRRRRACSQSARLVLHGQDRVYAPPDLLTSSETRIHICECWHDTSLHRDQRQA